MTHIVIFGHNFTLEFFIKYYHTEGLIGSNFEQGIGVKQASYQYRFRLVAKSASYHGIGVKSASYQMIAGLFDAYSVLEIGTYKPSSAVS